MMVRKKLFLFMMLVLLTMTGFAQDKKVDMADVMRSNGRIYVVVAVMLTILLGLILYVVRLDRKITKFEKDK